MALLKTVALSLSGGATCGATLQRATLEHWRLLDETWRQYELGEESVWDFLGLGTPDPDVHEFPSDSFEPVVLLSDFSAPFAVEAFLITTLPKGSLGKVTPDVLYIEYLATAPWNRGQRRRFSGIGEILWMYAIERSRAVGREGRIGLHSKPQAQAAYARKGMTDCGSDPDCGGRVYYLGDELWSRKVAPP